MHIVILTCNTCVYRDIVDIISCMRRTRNNMRSHLDIIF